MATNLPQTLPELLNWCTDHATTWASNPTALGLTVVQSNTFSAAVEALVAANTGAVAARQASKNATVELNNNETLVRAIAGNYINIIKAFAVSSDNPGVYAAAGISPPAPPSPAPAPVAPTNFTAGVNPDGSLTIKWKASQPVSAVSYIVTRRINGGEGPFTIVASEGANKSFVDTTLPVGVDKVEYIVQPKRGMSFGPQSAIFTVQFGSVGGGGAGGMSIMSTASTPHAEPMKIAA